MLCWWFKFLSQTSSANTLFALEEHIPFYFIAHKEMVPHTENNNWIPNRIPVPVNLVERATRTSTMWQLNNAVQKILHVCLSRNIFQKLMFNSKLESESFLLQVFPIQNVMSLKGLLYPDLQFSSFNLEKNKRCTKTHKAKNIWVDDFGPQTLWIYLRYNTTQSR